MGRDFSKFEFYENYKVKQIPESDRFGKFNLKNKFSNETMEKLKQNKLNKPIL
jgi:hypothetical protein